MPIRVLLPRQVKALAQQPGFYFIHPVPRLRRPAVTTWRIFARYESGFSYANNTLSWTGRRDCGKSYKAKVRQAVLKIRKVIKRHKMPPLTSVEFSYCADLDDLTAAARYIGKNIPGVERISLVAHPHPYDDEENQHYAMALEFNQGTLQELPWEITVTNSGGYELEYDPEYEGGDY